MKHSNGMHLDTLSLAYINLILCAQVVCNRRAASDDGRSRVQESGQDTITKIRRGQEYRQDIKILLSNATGEYSIWVKSKL
jgi:hypothetical protein